MKSFQGSDRASTRAEVLVILTLVSLVFAIAATSLADNRGRSQKIVCMDNLRQIGEGFDGWRFEHQDNYPWHAYTNDGGARGLNIAAAWFQFNFLSNIIASPRILVCPSDLKKLPKTAEHWGSSTGGFQNSGYRDNSVSYTIGLHSYPYAPLQLLSSDRNLKPDFSSSSCGPATLLSGAFGLSYGTLNASPGWTNDVHGLLGNILLSDGSVKEHTSATLKAFMQIGNDDNGVLHILIP
jgi:hypothetical protein